ncbi:MAG: hypothetical protein GY869_20920 [Planctomycetes bacterium]|nr:hypothetical protein [Planctomycetota bacterium]
MVPDTPYISISPYWLIDENNTAPWINTLNTLNDEHQNEMNYADWIKHNEPETIYIPAGVNLKLLLETPYDHQWCSFTFPHEISSQQGMTLDLGSFTLQPAVPVKIKVTDPDGNPIEGVPVRTKRDNTWSIPYPTNARGIADIFVEPNEKVIFGVYEHDTKKSKTESITCPVYQSDINKEITLRISKEMIKFLFGIINHEK